MDLNLQPISTVCPNSNLICPRHGVSYNLIPQCLRFTCCCGWDQRAQLHLYIMTRVKISIYKFLATKDFYLHPQKNSNGFIYTQQLIHSVYRLNSTSKRILTGRDSLDLIRSESLSVCLVLVKFCTYRPFGFTM